MEKGTHPELPGTPSGLNRGIFQHVDERLQALQAQDRYRFLRRVESAQDPRILLEGREVLLFCSNNYLGLANHPGVKQAACEAAERYGAGSGASRLISGNMTLHEEVEHALQEFMGSEACLLFNSGYQANVGILSSLMGSDDIIFSDALNHASLIDGCRLSRADVRIYRHRDTDHLETLLREARGCRNRLIVSDSLFSMDGDLAPMPELAELAARHSCLLMLDEAHAVGVMGAHGRGVAEHCGMADRVDISVGTLGKAFGSFGAFVVCSQRLRDYFINHARSFIYTTGLPPMVLAAALAATRIIQAEPQRRERLRHNARNFADGLRSLGCSPPDPVTPIQYLLSGEDARAMTLCEQLLTQGIYAQGIRPPTVPPGKSRIRFSLMATHTTEDIEQALGALGRVLN